MTTNYEWVDNPTMAGVSAYEPDVLNECLMHLKYDIPNSYDSKIENCSAKDLSNVTTAGIDRAISWGMPDYSAGVSISSVPFTADRNYLICAMTSLGTNANNYCYVDGETVFGCFHSSAYQEPMVGSFVLPKGSVLTTTGVIVGLRRFPFKGEENA